MVVVELGTGGAEVLAQGLRQRRGQGLEHGHGRAQPARRGRHLGPDEPGPDDDGPPAPRHKSVELGLDGEGVVERAQEVDALEGRRPRQGTGHGPGGDHEAVEGEPLASVELHATSVDIERRGPAPELQLQAQVVVAVVAQGDLVDRAGAGKQLLRERGPVIGEVLFSADEHEATVEALGPQRLRRPQPGE